MNSHIANIFPPSSLTHWGGGGGWGEGVRFRSPSDAEGRSAGRGNGICGTLPGESIIQKCSLCVLTTVGIQQGDVAVQCGHCKDRPPIRHREGGGERQRRKSPRNILLETGEKNR